MLTTCVFSVDYLHFVSKPGFNLGLSVKCSMKQSSFSLMFIQKISVMYTRWWIKTITIIHLYFSHQSIFICLLIRWVLCHFYLFFCSTLLSNKKIYSFILHFNKNASSPSLHIYLLQSRHFEKVTAFTFKFCYSMYITNVCFDFSHQDVKYKSIKSDHFSKPIKFIGSIWDK